MPPLPPAPGIFRIIPRSKMAGQDIRHVLHYLGAVANAVYDPAAIGAAFNNEWSTNVKSKQHTALTYEGCDVIDLGPDALPGAYVPFIGAQGGDGSGVPLPNNCAVVMSLKTAHRGRSYRGRAYHAGLSTVDVAGNVVNGARGAAIVSAWDALRVLQVPDPHPDLEMVVLSYYSNKALRPSPVATIVTSISSDLVVDSQRRRLPGRGN